MADYNDGKTIRHESLKEITERLQQLEKFEKRNSEEYQRYIQAIDDHLADVISESTKAANIRKLKLEENMMLNNEKISAERKTLLELKEKIENNIGENQIPNKSVSTAGEDLGETYSSKNAIGDNFQMSVVFRKGELKQKYLDSIIGYSFDLNGIEILTHVSLKCNNDPILFVQPTSESQALVHRSNAQFCEVIDKTGKTKRSRDMKCAFSDIVVLDNDEVIFNDLDDNSVKQISSEGKIMTVFQTSPFKPLAICLTSQQSLLVALSDSEFSNPGPANRRLVKQTTLEGDNIGNFEFMPDGETRLFNLPKRVTQNRNKDVCVVDQTGEYSGVLHVLTICGKHRFQYEGSRARYQFFPCDVACDWLSNIIVADSANHMVDILGPDGDFIKRLVSKKNGLDHPNCLGVYNSVLWIGCKNGTIKVYTYNRHK